MLFDLKNDPDELNDLGDSAEHKNIIDQLYDKLSQWALRASQRTTRSDADIIGMRGKSRRKGVLLGVVDGSELSEELLRPVTGKVQHRYIDE